MNNLEELPSGPLSKDDAVSWLSVSTGLDDQGIKAQMPLLVEHTGNVTIRDISGGGTRFPSGAGTRLHVVLEGQDTTYMVDLHHAPQEPTITPIEHDSVDDWRQVEGSTD